MREYSTPLEVSLPSGGLADTLLRHAESEPDRAAFARRTPDGWVDVSAAQFLAEVRGVARGLIAAGVSTGDRVALMSRTRYEWTLLDYALWYVGAVSVPVYETSSADQVGWVLTDSGARLLVVENQALDAKIPAEARASLDHVWTIDPAPGQAGVVEELTLRGRAVSDEDLESRRTALGPDSLATLVYTSGTTGTPRGCMITHGNLAFELGVVIPELSDLFADEQASTLLFLPLAHVFARILQVGAVEARVRLGHAADVRALPDDLSTLRPTFLLAVPRVFEKLFSAASQRAAAEGRGRVFNQAAETAIAFSRAQEDGKAGVLLRGRRAAFDRLVYARFRESLGGRCTHVISGGAPLGERLAHFYRGAGITVLEGYGLTETTAAVTANLPGAMRIGTVGRPLPGTTVRISEDGELLVNGGQVFAGYWQAPEATAAVLTDGGWLHTGDLGEIDDEGFVRITGRRKEILVTAGGKNVAPAVLEDRLRAHPLVDHVLVVGDGQPYVAALLTLDVEEVSRWAEQRGKPSDLTLLARDGDLLDELQRAVDETNRSVSQAESIRRFTVLTDTWSEESGQLTPSLKLKRNVVLREHRDDVAALFDR